MTAVNYLWNPLNKNIVREFDDVGGTVAEYTTEPEEFGNVVSQRRNGQNSTFHYDGQGSTLAVTNSAGSITDTRSYSAFGETTEQTGNTVIPFQYMGQSGGYQDIVDNIYTYYIRYRTLSISTGRWLSTDPISRNISDYIFVDNDPATQIDPSGLYSTTQCNKSLFKSVTPTSMFVSIPREPKCGIFLRSLRSGPKVTCMTEKCPPNYFCVQRQYGKTLYVYCVSCTDTPICSPRNCSPSLFKAFPQGRGAPTVSCKCLHPFNDYEDGHFFVPPSPLPNYWKEE